MQQKRLHPTWRIQDSQWDQPRSIPAYYRFMLLLKIPITIGQMWVNIPYMHGMGLLPGKKCRNKHVPLTCLGNMFITGNWARFNGQAVSQVGQSVMFSKFRLFIVRESSTKKQIRWTFWLVNELSSRIQMVEAKINVIDRVTAAWHFSRKTQDLRKFTSGVARP